VVGENKNSTLYGESTKRTLRMENRRHQHGIKREILLKVKNATSRENGLSPDGFSLKGIQLPSANIKLI
jgi:hypothetical protein